MITLIGFHTNWELKVYGVFTDSTFNYPHLELNNGVLNMELIKERLKVRDKLNPFYYTSPYLIAKVETEESIQLFKVSTELEIRVTYILSTEAPKTIDAISPISSFISIEKDRLDLNQRIFTSIKELLRPPTLILHNGNILGYNNGEYFPLDKEDKEDKEEITYDFISS
jgi:hypothetical protein